MGLAFSKQNIVETNVEQVEAVEKKLPLFCEQQIGKDGGNCSRGYRGCST